MQNVATKTPMHCQCLQLLEHCSGSQTAKNKITSTRKSGYNMYREWAQIEYQNKRYIIKQKDEGTEDRGRDGGTNFILRIKEQETHLILHKHDDDKSLKRSIQQNN
jgi:hypothetical protein